MNIEAGESLGKDKGREMSLTEADMTLSLHDMRSEIKELRAANRKDRSLDRERRLQSLRQRAGELLVQDSVPAQLPLASVADHFVGCNGLPEIHARDLNAEIMASAILHHGVLIVKGLYDKTQTDHLLNIATNRPELSREEEAFLFATPSEAFELFEIFDDSGLIDTVREYHDGNTVVFAERLKIHRRLAKHKAKAGLPWHQDINYFGNKCYAVNCWAAVTHCGVDNPGLGFIPRREEMSIGWDPASGQPRLTEGVDTLVSQIPEIIKTTPEVQIKFEPGDAALFDEMTIHRTAGRDFKVPQQIVTTS